MDGRIDLQPRRRHGVFRCRHHRPAEVDVRTRRSMGVDQLAALAELLHMESAGWNRCTRAGITATLCSAGTRSFPATTSIFTGPEASPRYAACRGRCGRQPAHRVRHAPGSGRTGEGRPATADCRPALSTDGPFVLLGDMNGWSRSGPLPMPRSMRGCRPSTCRAVQSAAASGHVGEHFECTNPNRRIDYIFLSHDLAVTGERSRSDPGRTTCPSLPRLNEEFGWIWR